MDQILSQLQLIKGVKGVIASSNTGKLLAITGNVDSFNLKEFNIEQLPRLAAIIHDLDIQQNGVQLSFSNLYLDFRAFSKGFMVIICEPEIDFSLVDLVLNRILSDLKNN